MCTPGFSHKLVDMTGKRETAEGFQCTVGSNIKELFQITV